MEIIFLVFILLTWLHRVLVVACGIFTEAYWIFSLWHAGFSLVATRRLSCPAACGILVLGPGIELASLALKGGFFFFFFFGRSINHWTTREVPSMEVIPCH